MIKTRKLFLTSLILIFLPFSVLAYESKAAKSISIAKDETINGNFYAAGQTINIDGIIEGDLICASTNLQINGEVKGDVICLAQTAILNGKIGGDLRMISENATVNTKIEGNTNLFGINFTLNPDSVVNKDLLVAAVSTNMNGKIMGDLHGALNTLDMNGEIEGNTKLRMIGDVENNQKNLSVLSPGLSIGNKAIINGNLFYTASKEAKIDEGAKIKGETSYSQPPSQKQNTGMNYIQNTIFSIFAYIMIGLVVINLFQSQSRKIIAEIKENKATSIGKGVIIMFIYPLIFIFLLFTVIGIPLAFLSLSLWVVSLYIGKLFAGILLGKELIMSLRIKNDNNQNQEPALLLSLIVGVIVLQLFSSIALFGWFISIAAIWLGLGGIFSLLQKSIFIR